MVFVFVVLSARIFAFDYRGDAEVEVYPDEPPLYYEFYSVDLNDITDILSLGLTIGSWNMYNALFFNYGYDMRIVENNTSLSQVVRNKMRQFAANVCYTIRSSEDSASLIINILMPNGNGTYTFIAYEGQWIYEYEEDWE